MLAHADSAGTSAHSKWRVNDLYALPPLPALAVIEVGNTVEGPLTSDD